MALKRRYRALLKRSRKMERMIKKAPHIKRRGERYGAPDRGEPQDFVLRAQLWRLWLANWRAIERYFREPSAPPEGIESFLKEMGMET